MRQKRVFFVNFSMTAVGETRSQPGITCRFLQLLLRAAHTYKYNAILLVISRIRTPYSNVLFTICKTLSAEHSPLLRANWASLVIASHSSSIMSLNLLLHESKFCGIPHLLKHDKQAREHTVIPEQ